MLQLSSRYVPKHKLAIGFEPGKQAYTGIWEGVPIHNFAELLALCCPLPLIPCTSFIVGFDIDIAVAAYVQANGYGGIFVWAVNDPKTAQTAATPPSVHGHIWQGSVGANAQYIAKCVEAAPRA